MKKPSDFTKPIYNSLFRESNAEFIFSNIMIILERLGNEWINLSWEQYKQERQKDGNFNEKELDYFEQVHPFTLSANLAQEVEDGIEGRIKRYRHEIEIVYFFNSKGSCWGFLLKDLEKLPFLLEHMKKEFKKFDTSNYELIELPLLSYNPQWKDNTGELRQSLNTEGYFIEASKFLDCGKNINRKKYIKISLMKLMDIQENDFFVTEFINPQYYYYDD